MNAHAPCSACTAEFCTWKGRRAVRLTNGVLEVVALRVGGHIAAISRAGEPGVNMLWEAPWQTIEPDEFRDAQHAAAYGAGFVGRYLSGYTGHTMVLGYFGAPTEAQIARGLPLHGEPASSAWRVDDVGFNEHLSRVVMSCAAPAFGLKFTRTLELRAGESFLRLSEAVQNEAGDPVQFQWVQHATFGEPLLTGARVWLPAKRAITWPLGYEGKGHLADDLEFTWPHAPLPNGGNADISRPFAQGGTGHVAAVQLDVEAEHGFVAATNSDLRAVAGYVFPTRAYPWVAVWEESRARDYAPWNGVTRALGLEFGNTPLPLGLEPALQQRELFGTPTFSTLAPGESAAAEYFAFFTAMPREWDGVARASASQQGIALHDAHGRALQLASNSYTGPAGMLHRIQETG